jgi:hypothetical protein
LYFDFPIVYLGYVQRAGKRRLKNELDLRAGYHMKEGVSVPDQGATPSYTVAYPNASAQASDKTLNNIYECYSAQRGAKIQKLHEW